MKRGFIFFAILLFSELANGGVVSRIQVKLSNYSYKTVLLGYYLGGKTYVKDTVKVNNGVAVFEYAEKMEKGMYCLVNEKLDKTVNLLVDDDMQQISLELDFDKPNDMAVTGSKATADLVAYYRFLDVKRKEIEPLSKQLELASAEQKKTI